MNYFVAIVVSIVFVNAQNESRGPQWGDIKGSFRFTERATRLGIPLMTRTTVFNYPMASETTSDIPILRGIEHVNLVDKSSCGCEDPIVVLKDGGINTAKASIEITTRRGCPLDSVIYYYGYPNNPNDL